MKKLWMLGITGAIAAALLIAAGAQDAGDQAVEDDVDVAADVDDEAAVEEAPEGPPIHVVERGDLVLKVERDGRLESADRVKVRVAPEAYSGPLEFVEVARRGGTVEAGEVLFRFDDSRLEENLRQAQESLEGHVERLELAKQEQAILAESNARRLEQAEKSLADAEAALEVWTNYQGPRMLRASELSLEGSQNNVRNQREELAQLEMMYEGTELASETKEIVLERARRSLAITEGWLELSQNDRTVTVEFTHPRQHRDTHDNVRYRTQELEHLRVSTAIAETRKSTEILGIERAIRDGNDRLAKLEADRERLIVRAPESGLMTAADFQPGDTANARQVLTEIMAPSARTLKFNATAADLRVLREGDRVRLSFPDYPEIDAGARVREIAPIGQASGEATHFPVVVEVEDPNPNLRIGLRGKVIAERTLENVVLLPRKAVTFEAGRAYVKVRETEDADPVRRAVTLGASNDEFHHVVSGLDRGDTIVLEKE